MPPLIEKPRRWHAEVVKKSSASTPTWLCVDPNLVEPRVRVVDPNLVRVTHASARLPGSGRPPGWAPPARERSARAGIDERLVERAGQRRGRGLRGYALPRREVREQGAPARGRDRGEQLGRDGHANGVVALGERVERVPGSELRRPPSGGVPPPRDSSLRLALPHRGSLIHDRFRNPEDTWRLRCGTGPP